MASATKKGSKNDTKGKRKPVAGKADAVKASSAKPAPAKPAPAKAPKAAGAPRRRDEQPTTAISEPERAAPPLAEIDADALEFIEAIDRFKKQHGRPFPSWSEVLMVVRQLGYRRS